MGADHGCAVNKRQHRQQKKVPGAILGPSSAFARVSRLGGYSQVPGHEQGLDGVRCFLDAVSDDCDPARATNQAVDEHLTGCGILPRLLYLDSDEQPLNTADQVWESGHHLRPAMHLEHKPAAFLDVFPDLLADSGFRLHWANPWEG